MIKKVEDITTARIKRDTLQKMRVVASIDGQEPLDWLEITVNLAYESRVSSNKKHIK